MMLTPEQKEHAIDLIDNGDKLEAVRYLQETIRVTAEDALLLAEKLEEELEVQAEAEFQAMTKDVEMPATKGINVGKVVGGIFFGVGIIMLAITGIILYSGYTFKQRAQPVQGKVINYNSYQSSNENGGYTTMYTPVYQYEFGGQTYTQVSSISSSSQEYSPGEAVKILVDPQNPKEIVVDSFAEQGVLPLILGILGLIFSGVGSALFRFLGRAEIS